jgi:hypothetical protein
MYDFCFLNALYKIVFKFSDVSVSTAVVFSRFNVSGCINFYLNVAVDGESKVMKNSQFPLGQFARAITRYFYMVGIWYGWKEAQQGFTEPSSRLAVEAVRIVPYRNLLTSTAYACVVPQLDITLYLLRHVKHYSS